MIAGGKDKYVCLLTLIKHESKELYEMICDLCLDHTFRSQRYQNTFLMPSSDVIKTIKKMYEADKDDDAITAIRSLILKGHLSKASFVKGAMIGTIDPDMVLESPETVGSKISPSKKTIVVTKKGAYATVVLSYSGDLPKLTAGKTGGFIPVGIGGGKESGVDKNAEIIKKHTLSMIVMGNSQATVDNFFKGVCVALASIKTDSTRYTQAKYYMAENPILSWFFLTLPGSNDALIKGEDLKDFNFNNIHDCQEHLQEAMDGYEFNKGTMLHIKDTRDELKSNSDRNTPEKIQKAYANTIKTWKGQQINPALQKNVHLKLLMDELRFMYESAISHWNDVDDAISHLGSIDWTSPEKALVISSKEVQAQLKSAEVFTSGPIKFIQSIYFLYMPLSNSVTETLSGIQGGSEYANPATIRSVIYSGGAARKKMQSSSSKFDAKSLIRKLTAKQLDMLKQELM